MIRATFTAEDAVEVRIDGQAGVLRCVRGMSGLPDDWRPWEFSLDGDVWEPPLEAEIRDDVLAAIVQEQARR
jgi:hypothetical protein